MGILKFVGNYFKPFGEGVVEALTDEREQLGGDDADADSGVYDDMVNMQFRGLYDCKSDAEMHRRVMFDDD